MKAPLSSIHLLHTDRGNEFDNHLIDELLDTFGIVRSLSAKGCPYDDAVAEATFKSIKSEFVYQEAFDAKEDLEIKWFDYMSIGTVTSGYTAVWTTRHPSGTAFQRKQVSRDPNQAGLRIIDMEEAPGYPFGAGPGLVFLKSWVRAGQSCRQRLRVNGCRVLIRNQHEALKFFYLKKC